MIGRAKSHTGMGRHRYWPDMTTWVVGLGSTAALAGQSASPWVVSALVKSAGFPIEQAGLLVTAEMIAMGLIMLVVAPFVDRISAKPSAAVALTAIIGAQIWSAIAGGFVPVILARVSAGLGFGLLFALASALGARSAMPERTYATAGVIVLLIGTTINPILGASLERFGHAGVFLAIAGYGAAIGLPLLLLRFPPPVARATATGRAAVARMPISAVSAVGVIGVMALLAVAVNGVFVLLTTIAGNVGLAGTKLGSGMAAVSFVSALGGVIAARVGDRFGTLAPLACGLAVMGVTLVALTVVNSAWAFWIVFTALVTGYWFLWPYIFGLATVVDPSGRLAAATGSAKILAGGLGSGVAGYAVAWGGPRLFGFIALGLCGAALALAVFVVGHIGRLPRAKGQTGLR